MIIREMKKEDKEAVFNMMRVFYNSDAVIYTAPDAVLKRDIDDCLSENPYIEGYVFEEENKILGYSMIAKSYSTEYGGLCIWIEDIYIKPEFQGKGIGAELFKYIEEKYKGKAVRFRLEAEKENVNALKLYNRCGYKELEYMQLTKEY